MRVLGWNILLIAVFFNLTMTKYFGGNLLPHTKEEILCGLVTLILVVVGFVLVTRKKPLHFN